MFPDHPSFPTKLLSASQAKVALAASCEVMDTDAIGLCEAGDVRAHFFDYARNLMSESDRQKLDRRNSRSVMRVGMANAGGFHADQNIVRADWRDGDLTILKRQTRFDEANGFHLSTPS
jgi:hypothetical protein